MWLDRLTQTGPPGASPQSPRSYSPHPQRASANFNPYVTSQRGSYTQRGLSTTLLPSSTPTHSLLGLVKGPDGPRSKTLIEPSRPLEEDLEKLLGAPIYKRSKDGSSFHDLTNNDLNTDFDFDGQSLYEFVSRASKNSDNVQIVQGCELESTDLEILRTSITECDGVLSSVESNFTSFRNELASVSADIESLQHRSAALNIRLENRKAIEKSLSPVVEDLSVPPVIVAKLVDGQIDESWIKALGEIDKRLTAYRRDTSSSAQNKAWTDLGPLLDKLVLKAIERIRDHLVSQIKALRSPNINAQVIQQHKFLHVKEAYAFLYRHHSILGDEICLAYMNTMRWYYLAHFTRYCKALGKIKVQALDKYDVLGHEEAPRKASLLASTKPFSPQHDAFNLGRRMDILKMKTQTALPSYLAEEDQTTHHTEIPFRNFNLALADNVSAEYTFLSSFFSPPLALSQIAKHFGYIFEPTFALGQMLTKTMVSDSYDGLGLLLCIRLNQRFAFELQRRKVPTMDTYMNATNMLLWPRLQLVIDHHCESLRQAANSASSRSTGRSAGDQAKLSVAPHVVTQRFGQFLQGILILCSEAGDDEPLMASIRRLRVEMDMFLAKQAKHYSDTRKQQRFLYNNYSLILTIISDTDGRMSLDQQEYFERLRDSHLEALA